jgi:hypothetical protein
MIQIQDITQYRQLSSNETKAIQGGFLRHLMIDAVSGAGELDSSSKYGSIGFYTDKSEDIDAAIHGRPQVDHDWNEHQRVR